MERLSNLNINLNLFPSSAVVKNPSANAGHAGDSVSIPGPERAPGIGGKSPLSRKWQPTLVFLLGKSYEQRSLVGYSPWGHKKSDRTEQAGRCIHRTLNDPESSNDESKRGIL